MKSSSVRCVQTPTATASSPAYRWTKPGILPAANSRPARSSKWRMVNICSYILSRRDLSRVCVPVPTFGSVTMVLYLLNFIVDCPAQPPDVAGDRYELPPSVRQEHLRQKGHQRGVSPLQPM